MEITFLPTGMLIYKDAVSTPELENLTLEGSADFIDVRFYVVFQANI